MRIQIKNILFALLMLTAATTASAQRHTDNLNRGLVAVQPAKAHTNGVFLSWRIQPDEYYDVTYNVYHNGQKLNDEPLTASNYLHTSGTFNSNGTPKGTYTVAAVVNGVEQPQSGVTRVFSTDRDKNTAPGHLAIPMQDVYSRNNELLFCACGQHTAAYTWYSNDKQSDGTYQVAKHEETLPVCKHEYTLNDACLADLDGDGEIEIIVKRINQTDASAYYPKYMGTTETNLNGTSKYLYEQSNTSAYTLIEAYKLDGTRLWWIDCGPNMVSLNSTEINCVAYDWDEDGKAEVIMRGADNMIIHKADGSVYNVGNMSVNSRGTNWTDAQYAWTHSGAEYLLYLNGTTAEPYSITDFPLKRLESGETSEKSAWGDDYGHRSSKYFFGAPFLDGKKAYIFLARGIYTRTKMVALEVNSNHSLTTKWTWNCNTKGDWYGQGNHNFSIADVDGDGCDEIVYGSMVIDNNGKGLSTTGLGHGDALHVGDFDPFRKGLEVFACNEESKGCNYRDATTSEILYWHSAGTNDDGRALMGNFTNDVPGAVGRSWFSPMISAVTASENTALGNLISVSGGVASNRINGRIYWDGDLLEEYYDSPGTEGEFMACKPGGNRVFQTTGCKMNNDSKNNPCAVGDILGDWREEVVARASDNRSLRVYSTDLPTAYRIPSLWYDHQYRQGQVWWVCAYNQPPHTSFFLGELEDITRAPLPLTNTGRKELAKNSIVTTPGANEDKAIMLCEAGNYGIDAAGAAPSLLVVNVPSTVSGTAESNSTNGNPTINYNYSQTQLGATINGTNYKGDLTGAMRLVKQGDGLLKLTARTFSYTGDTEIWGGTFYFRGTLDNSSVWMNRHTDFFCGATIKNALTMEYGATLYPSKDKVSASEVEYATATIGTLNMHEGSRIVFQYQDNNNKDQVNIGALNIRKRNWEYGPQYLAPVFVIQSSGALPDGKYMLGTLGRVDAGKLSDIIIECNAANSGSKRQLIREAGNLYLVIGEYTSPGATTEEWVETYRLDFEQASSNNYGFTISNGATISQYELSESSHCLHANPNGGSGGRSANRSFVTDEPFATTNEYSFEFDWGLIYTNIANASSDQSCSTTELVSDHGSLFKIETWGNYSTPHENYGKSVLTDRNGVIIHNDIPNSGEYSSRNTFPAKRLHFTITSSASGTFLTITDNGSEVVSNYMLYDGRVCITALNNMLGRSYAQLAIDDIILKEHKVTGTLSDVIDPLCEAGFYNTLNVTRSLIAGYNTFCVPFNTTAEEIAGAGAKAYTLKNASEQAGTVSLNFKEVDEIEANMPYLLYAPNAVAVPNFSDITIETPASRTQYVDGWSFVSNYEPEKGMQGCYVVAGDALRRGGAGAYVNGMRAYFVAPASSAKSFVLTFGDADDTPTLVGSIKTEVGDGSVAKTVYSIGGVRQVAIGKGLNIVRMSDGTVKKIFVK